MPSKARAADLRLALLSLFTAADMVDPATCRRALDAATAAAYSAPAALLGDASDPACRFAAARVLNSLCAACANCSRGRDVETEPVMLDAPPG